MPDLPDTGSLIQAITLKDAFSDDNVGRIGC